MPAPNALLTKLATIYSQDDIRHPALRGVTLAQWMLESGRATSDLAKLHYNFAGLKWRPEMAGIATKVRYQANDGVDDYCKFATIENFITGYWVFLNRAPYSGWESHIDTPQEFIRFIAPIYTPSPNYPNKVLALLDEAEQLLDAVRDEPEVATTTHAPGSAAENLGTVVLDPGHGGTVRIGGSDPNHAISITGVKEKKLTLDFCMLLQDLLVKKAQAANKSVKVVLTRTADVNLGLADRAAVCKANKAKLFLIIHFNGWDNPDTRGTETYYKANGNLNLNEDKQFCELVQSSLVSSLKSIDTHAKDRGVKKDTDSGPGGLGILNDHSMGNDTLNPRCRAAYVELEFITNPGVEKQLISGPNAMANRELLLGNLADKMLDYLSTF